MPAGPYIANTIIAFMLSAATLTFLSDLKKNNSKVWFDNNRPNYEVAKKDFLNFTTEVIKALGNIDTQIGTAVLEPKSCISRINRDVRFSKNKDPYKTNFFALISAGGKKGNKSAYYVQIEPGSSFLAAGVYMPMPDDLQKFRQEIDYNFKGWNSIVSDPAFLSTFPEGIKSPETLSRPPKGYDADNKAIEFLKMKGFYVSTPISNAELQNTNAVELIVSKLQHATPLCHFLNKAL